MCWQFWALFIVQDSWSGQEGVGKLLLPPLVEEEAPRDVKVVSVVSKAIWWQLRLGEGLVIAKFVKPWVIMSGLLVPLLKVQKLHFSLMTNSSGMVSFGVQQIIFWQTIRWEVAAQKNEGLWLKMVVVPTLLGKFQLSLLGDVPVVSHQCHLSHEDIYQWNCRS